VYAHAFLHWRKRRGTAVALGRTLAVAVVPLAVLAGLRAVIAPNQPDDLLASLQENVAFRWRHLADNQWYVLTLGTWGVVFPLLLLFPARVPSLCRRHFDQLAPALLVYASLLVSNNTERPLAYAVPALLPAALHNLRAFVTETRLPTTPVAAAAVAVQAVVWSQTRLFEMGVSIYQPANLGVAALLAACWIAGRLALARAPRPRAAAAAQ
jgi:hypothetical protein